MRASTEPSLNNRVTTRSTAQRPPGAFPKARPPAPTIVSWPAPPAPGSSPVRPRVGTLAAWPAPPAAAPVRDALDVLRENVGELELLGTAWQAAGVCAAALAKAFGARAVIIHAHDASAREIRTIGVHGRKTHDVLGATEHVDDDFVAFSVIRQGQPMAVRFDGERPCLAPARLAGVGATSSLVAIPVMAPGGCAAMIEIIDPQDVTVERVMRGARIVAEQLARVLGPRAAAA